jgi:hypothetical protein
MAATTIGLSSLSFGTTDEAGAVVTSYEETLRCEPVELLAGDGTFGAVAFANPNGSVNITIVSGSPPSGIGAAFTSTVNNFITGLPSNLYVESATSTQRNDGFLEMQISAVGWNNLNQSS